MTFERPEQALRCALALRDAVSELGLELRQGLHVGGVEREGAAVSGITVHTGKRVMAGASAGEILVTGTLREIAAGAGLRCTERGTHTVKGALGRWQIWAVEVPVQ